MPTNFCRHIRANGTRCNSPALRRQALCYFHTRDRERYPNLAHRTFTEDDATPAIIHPVHTGRDGMQRDPIVAEYLSSPPLETPAELNFPPLEDRESIQVALSMLLSALGRNQLDPKRAGMMLYGLQVASANAKSLNHGSPATVTDVVLDDHGRELAPDEDPQDASRLGLLDSLFQSLEPASTLDSAENSSAANTLADPLPDLS